jgi:hypothetical protein
MTKKSKQSKKATRHSKRSKTLAKPEDEPDTATTSTAKAPESISVSPQTEEAGGPVESQQAESTVAPATKAETAPRSTRSDAAKATSRKDCSSLVLQLPPVRWLRLKQSGQQPGEFLERPIGEQLIPKGATENSTSTPQD